jgi:hypothetical protein
LRIVTRVGAEGVLFRAAAENARRWRGNKNAARDRAAFTQELELSRL